MNMEYKALLARYTEALQTILELEIQIWELCSQNSQLRQALDHAISAEDSAKQEETFTSQDRIGQRGEAT